MSACPCGKRKACSDNVVTRRVFVAHAGMTAIATMLASACGDGVIGGLGPSFSTFDTFTFNLGDHPELATVGGRAVIPEAPVPIVAVRDSSTTVAVYSLVCPHAGTTISLVTGGFKCPNHGAQWDQAGGWVGGQQTSDLVQLEASLGTDGVVTVRGGGGNVDLTIRIADYPALLAVGGVARVSGQAAIPVGVGRTGASEFVAYGLTCPHEQYVVGPNGAGWQCPEHGARFGVDGSLQLGPATVGLTQLTVTYDEAKGTLRIRGQAPVPNGDDDDDDDS